MMDVLRLMLWETSRKRSSARELLIDAWLQKQYKGLDRYIIHDAVAREVDRDTFFHTRAAGT